MTCNITKHAEKRMIERFACTTKTVKKEAGKAYRLGYPRIYMQDCPIRRYMDSRSIGREHFHADLKLWREHIFVFRGNTLVTVLTIPDKYL